MSFAFGHLIGAWIIGRIYEWKKSTKLPSLAWFFLLLGGIIPDADYLLDWTLGTQLHRTFSHSLLFALVLPTLIYLFFRFKQDNFAKTYALALSAGILTHIFLDSITGSGTPLLWPLAQTFSLEQIFVGQIPPTALVASSVTDLQESLKWAIFDMGLGTAWIFFLWWRAKLKF